MTEAQFSEIVSKAEKISWRDSEYMAFLTHRIIDIAKSKGYKSTHSKKARLFLGSRAFHTEKESYMTYRVTEFLRDPLFSIAAIRLFEIKTSGGIMYVQPATVEMRASNDVVHMCLTSHVFDRFGDRIMGARDRRSSIKELMTEILVGGFIADTEKMRKASENGRGPIVMYIKSGMLLGEFHTDGKQELILYKTFVSTNTARPGQDTVKIRELKVVADKVHAGEKLSFSENTFLKNYIEDEINKHKQNEQAADN